MKPSTKPSKLRLWISYLLQGLIILLFLMGAIQNLLQTEMAVTGATQMGYPASAVPYLGIVLLISVILYALPRTTVLGALLLTTWLGGAVATHIIHNDPVFNIVFPILFGVLVWSGIALRNDKLRQVLWF